MPRKYFSMIKKNYRINLKEVQVNEKEKQNMEELNRIGENEKHLKKREE